MNIFRRLFGSGEDSSPPPRPAAHQQSEATTELRQAQEELRRSRGHRREAEAMASRLRQGNEENHFAELLRSTMKGVIE